MRLRKRQRLILVSGGALLLAAAAALVLVALEDSVAFFVSPAQVAAGEVEAGRRFRIGGLVAAGSVQRAADGVVRFDVTDEVHTVQVAFRGLLPDLFREGQGIVAQGTLTPDGVFFADEVLAKHDETYMPPEVAEALERAHREAQ